MIGSGNIKTCSGFQCISQLFHAKNTETGELDINIVDDKYQKIYKYILNNSLIDAKQNQITDTINYLEPPIMEQLDYGNWINQNPLPLLEDNNTTEIIQNRDKGAYWFTSYEISWTNYSRTLLNVVEYILYIEGNEYGVIDTLVIQTTLENDFIHKLNDLSKQNIYIYLVSKLIG